MFYHQAGSALLWRSNKCSLQPGASLGLCAKHCRGSHWGGKWQQRWLLKFGQNEGWGLGCSNIAVLCKPWYDCTWEQAVLYRKSEQRCVREAKHTPLKYAIECEKRTFLYSRMVFVPMWVLKAKATSVKKHSLHAVKGNRMRYASPWPLQPDHLSVNQLPVSEDSAAAAVILSGL